MVPSAFGRYQIIEEIGRGGMARVYRAVDPRFEREVAVKVLPSEVMDEEMFRARFEREAKVIAGLEHPAIVPVYDFGDQDGQPYLVMRYMPGGSLRERLAEGKMDPGEAADLVRRMASALDHAHEHGIIHRDLKPGNILFDGRGDPFLTDFGIVKMAQGGATLTGEAIIGTPAYMSPEQAQGDTTIDHRTDIYSLGVILFEMLTGEQPYQADTPISLALKHIREPIPRLFDYDKDLPVGMQAIVDKAMAKSPVDRFGSAARMVQAMEALEAGHETRLGAAPVVVNEESESGSETAIEAPSEPPVHEETGLGATLQPVAVPEGETVVADDEQEVPPPEPDVVQAEEQPARDMPIVEPIEMNVQRPSRKLPSAVLYGGGALAVVLLGIVGFFAVRGILSAAPKPTATSPVPVVQATSVVAPTEPPAQAPAPWPEVSGEPPAENVGAFYYPWYGNPDVDGEWIHWQQGDQPPPENLASDYFPMLGPYSSMDPAVVAQHFAWLRQAGVGVVITSWWGPGDRTDQAVPMLLEIADHYGLKVAFHIEPYEERNAATLVDHLKYIVDSYGGSPAFYRTADPSLWDDSPEPRGLFFLFAPDHQPGNTGGPDPGYWTEAMDVIHRDHLGIVLASTPDVPWVVDGHFDGLYNYVSPDPDGQRAFTWASTLPASAWYVPSVMPGFSAKTVGYPDDSFFPRNNGATYDSQWEGALNQGVKPNLVSITSFNEWHEGTAIEPASVDKPGGPDRYADFGAVGPLGYLERTQAWVRRFEEMEFPEGLRLRVHMVTTSDWTYFRLLRGGRWQNATLVAADDGPGEHSSDVNFINLSQPIQSSQAGGQVERVFDLVITGFDPQGDIRFAIDRGHLGSTTVELYRMQGNEPVLVNTMRWGGIVEGDANRRIFDIPVADITGP
jgi:serine/threonine protein kinase